MEVCEQRDKITLHGIIQKHVHRGSIIHSDGWRAYQGLEKYGYQHSTVNHKEEFVAQDGAHTQRIESNWRNMRRRLSQGGKPHDDLAEYMIEYMWMRKCKKQNKDPFAELVKAVRAV